MQYIVIELQSTGSSVSNIVSKYSTLNEAESKFHQILGAAAISNVPVHSAVILTDEGYSLKHECYKHITE